MSKCKTPSQIEKMRKAGRILAECRNELSSFIKPGVSTADIDGFVEHFLKRKNASPAQKGYRGYPFATCAAVNDIVCHGLPGSEPLAEGDIVTIDTVAALDGWHADSAWSFAVGEVPPHAQRLLEASLECLNAGMEKAYPGNTTGDIGYAIEQYATKHGYAVVRDFAGHGIGRKIHEFPFVPHFGKKGSGTRLEEGMVLTIEPILTTGTWFTFIDDDGWTARTVDGSLSAQFEHTIAVSKNGPDILTTS
ncbi:type I methionyl aminopeptidase [Bacillus marinisedimentorum]|uniref:type I methionyl aminopeptidase n=1 Tax=Bacillus marinisedimentorum TaxID=1821260 RepID=UPI0007DED2D0|nr:type I methionyl aminopeptidase [Bacillus marinisedimentorum]